MNAGLSKDSSALNCKDLKTKVPSATSGVYWIDPDAGSHGNAFQAYCDQQTDGGGGLWSGVIPSQLIQGSRLARTLSLHYLHGQPAVLTHECPPQFHWARRIMKPWTLLCGAPLEKNSLSRVTSTTGSLARKVLEASWCRNRGPSAVNWSNKFQSSVLVLCQSPSRCTPTVLTSTVQATTISSPVVGVEVGPRMIRVAEIKRIK